MIRISQEPLFNTKRSRTLGCTQLSDLFQPEFRIGRCFRRVNLTHLESERLSSSNMANESDDEFTFCQVGSVHNGSSSDAQKTVEDIGNITLKDEVSRSVEGDVSASNRSTTDDTRKEERVGSLSFSVKSATPLDQSTKAPAKQYAGGAGNYADTVAEEILRTRKPIVRTKVPFEKGYSQMDWLKLMRTHPDLADLKGQSNRRLISLNEVKQHKTEDSMWTVLKGRVYNITPYMKFHPGGVDMLMKAVGKDCTSLFNKYHAWVNDDFLLEKCLVGILDESGNKK